MNQDDRYRTTSWDGDEVARQTGESVRSAGEGGAHAASRPAGNGKKRKKRKKKRTNPLLAILLWLAIVGTSSAIFAAVGWMLANDFAALNKPLKEVSFQVTEDFVDRVEKEKQEDGSTKEVTHYDMKKVSASLKEQGLIEYDWFFRLFAWFSHADTKLTTGTFVLSTEMDYMALIRSMRTSARLMEPMIMDFPAPVSPVRILSPPPKVTSVSSIKARFFTCKLCSIFSSFQFIHQNLCGECHI